MNDQDFESLKRAMSQVKSFQSGKTAGFVVHSPVDIKAVRAATAKTQAQFASAYRLPVGTVRDWEQGRRAPDAPARSLLAAIQRDPAVMERLLSEVE